MKTESVYITIRDIFRIVYGFLGMANLDSVPRNNSCFGNNLIIKRTGRDKDKFLNYVHDEMIIKILRNRKDIINNMSDKTILNNMKDFIPSIKEVHTKENDHTYISAEEFDELETASGEKCTVDLNEVIYRFEVKADGKIPRRSLWSAAMHRFILGLGHRKYLCCDTCNKCKELNKGEK